MYKKLFVFALVLFFVVQANAQGLSIGPQLGFYKANDADQTKMMYGAAARAKLLPMLGVEGAINYRQESYANDLVKVKSWPITVTGMLYVLPIVYGALGAGWYNVTIDYDQSINDMGFADKTTQKFGWHLGAGAELPLGSAKLAGDLRYVFLDYKLGEVLKDLPNSDNQVNSNFYVISVSLLFGL
jgi:opacity protein-like surface antigen